MHHILGSDTASQVLGSFDVTAGVTKCFGFICDDDGPIADRPLGHVPIMSKALIQAWAAGKRFY